MHETPVHLPSGVDSPEGLIDAFWEYERALLSNDLAALDRLFAPGVDTLRGDASGLLVGHEAIGEFRAARGGAPARTIEAVFVRPIDDDNAVVVAVTLPATGGRGQQTQLWARIGGGADDAAEGRWVVQVAHVSAPAKAIASATWRIVGDPLVKGSAAEDGALAGMTVAVKDLFEVKGFAVGAGVPDYLVEASVAKSNAPAVDALLGAGASIQGIAQTDEFAFSIAGKNIHYGTPLNPAVLGALPGGSSSGPASAVASGQVTIGLGTDTGGSIRVPASYQGLWGLRTTHGAVSRAGLTGLAPTFDTVGWLTRDAATLRAAASTSMSFSRQAPAGKRFALAPAVADHASKKVRAAFDAAVTTLQDAGAIDDLVTVTLPDIDDLFQIFRTVQSAEAWRLHGAWIEAHPGALAPEIEARFRFGESIDADTVEFAKQALGLARVRIDSVLHDRVLLLPSASSVAPLTTIDDATMDARRAATLRLTCVAGISERPGLSIPALHVEAPLTPRAPVGFGLVGPLFSDLALIDLGAELAEVLGV